MGVRPTAAARGVIAEAEVRERRERIVVDVKCILRAGLWLFVVVVVDLVVVGCEGEFMSGRGGQLPGIYIHGIIIHIHGYQYHHRYIGSPSAFASASMHRGDRAGLKLFQYFLIIVTSTSRRKD
jgi:hypothetical protein